MRRFLITIWSFVLVSTTQLFGQAPETGMWVWSTDILGDSVKEEDLKQFYLEYGITSIAFSINWSDDFDTAENKTRVQAFLERMHSAGIGVEILFGSHYYVADDRLQIVLSENVTDWCGYPVVGGHDQESGGPFRYDFNVLIGDIDQSGTTDIVDALKIRQVLFSAAGHENYSVVADLDGSSSIDILDALAVRNHLFNTLPDGESGQ